MKPSRITGGFFLLVGYVTVGWFLSLSSKVLQLERTVPL